MSIPEVNEREALVLFPQVLDGLGLRANGLQTAFYKRDGDVRPGCEAFPRWLRRQRDLQIGVELEVRDWPKLRRLGSAAAEHDGP